LRLKSKVLLVALSLVFLSACSPVSNGKQFNYFKCVEQTEAELKARYGNPSQARASAVTLCREKEQQIKKQRKKDQQRLTNEEKQFNYFKCVENQLLTKNEVRARSACIGKLD
jgi:hypothetical protein